MGKNKYIETTALTKELNEIHFNQIDRNCKARKKYTICMSKEHISKYESDKKIILWGSKNT
jgi:hypothetical protein